MRTEMFVLDGLVCVDVADESADWSLVADWLATCTPEGPAAWLACWDVSLVLPAAEFAADVLLWFTAPPSPGLPMRTEMFVFDGCTWVELADELADCWLPADWPTPCTGNPSAAADPAAIAGRRTALAMNARRRRLIWVRSFLR
jgi:hypothetical protein